MTRVERGEMLRIDSTVTDASIHEPTDSTLLGDSMRVLVRLLEQATALAEGVMPINYRNHQRMARNRVRAICYTRGQDKKRRLYRGLIEVTQKKPEVSRRGHPRAIRRPEVATLPGV